MPIRLPGFPFGLTGLLWERGFERRGDGWPLCPQCGEDELWSPLVPSEQQRASQLSPMATVTVYVRAGLACYKCEWSSIFPPRVWPA